jgi:lysophospholipase L1-like esterase
MKRENRKSAIVWGDSLARGVVYDEKRERYCIVPRPAATMVANELGMDLINRSRMGMTTTQGLAALQKDLKRGLTADYAVLEFGGNDCDFDWSAISRAPDTTHNPKTPAELFEKNMKEMISSVQRAGMTPILVNLPPVHAEQYFHFIARNGLSESNILHWLGDVFHIYRYQERYSMLVTHVAKECGCRILDVRSAFLNLRNSASLFCRDGIHPTEEGQELIGSTILAEI